MSPEGVTSTDVAAAGPAGEMTTTSAPTAADGGPRPALSTRIRSVLLRLDLVVRRLNAQYELSRAQTSILHTLACHGQLRMTELARLEHVRVPTTSNSVSVIESLGYVERVPDETDRRGVCVRLTDLGRNRIEQALRDRDRDLERLLAQLAPEHRATLDGAVPALNALLDALDADTR